MRLRLSVMLALECLLSVAIAGGGLEVRRQRILNDSSHSCKLFAALLCGSLGVKDDAFQRKRRGFYARWGELQLADVHEA